MGRKCCVSGCPSNSRLPEHHGVTYHSYPLDPIIRTVWMRNTRLSSDRQITKSVLVCSRHFRRADFQPQRSGKYLLKQRVFPTVFPWGKIDPEQVEADLEQMKASGSPTEAALTSNPIEDATKATVEAKVAQIMAETAELNASSGNKTDSEGKPEAEASSPAYKYESVSSFKSGMRLEVQSFDGQWHSGRVSEIDNNDHEVLIKFERNSKNKSPLDGTEEWIPMNSSRLRIKVSTRPVPVFALEEKCMARWSGPRKFPGTVKQILGNDTYEVLFDDGYVKNVRAIHMNKIRALAVDASPAVQAEIPAAVALPKADSIEKVNDATPLPAKEDVGGMSPMSSAKKKKSVSGSRKDWPLLDMSKLDLVALNLPEIPKDGEWACHWVNDQPIGKEGFLIVGEHRKPTVIVQDWRLPPGWVKHMYQRSNVLGKWDVILVTPGGKRFRSKSDLKTYLEEQGLVYNPDVYDFSIHRRRAKDINAYAYTADYSPQPVHKSKPVDTSLPGEERTASRGAISSPKVEVAPETGAAQPSDDAESMALTVQHLAASDGDSADIMGSPVPSGALGESGAPILEDGYAYIGSLKVQIVDNLFLCPQEGCSKNFRKENHLQMHIKYYHKDLVKMLGACPKMLELAEKRTHPITLDRSEPTPKNQIPNQQFFAKLHQQDLQQSRSYKKGAVGSGAAGGSSMSESESKGEISVEAIPEGTEEKPKVAELSSKQEDVKPDEEKKAKAEVIPLPKSPQLKRSVEKLVSTSPASAAAAVSSAAEESFSDLSSVAPKRSRISPSKRPLGSRRSNRQRTTRTYLTAATGLSSLPPVVTADSSFGVSDLEETRHSFNTTPDVKKAKPPARPLSSLDSPITADSGSSSLQQIQTPPSNEQDGLITTQYIKENGEIIKIVRMRQEEIINCICGYGEEDGLMIQCELCLCWQHGICNGIDKEGDVPEKYVCYICRNPQRGRESMRFRHDQDWLYEGKLPVANYHSVNPNLGKRFDFLKKSHTLLGNLLELRNFMHSLQIKMNIAKNRDHPKMYLWAKKWEEDPIPLAIKSESGEVKRESHAEKRSLEADASPTKRIKIEGSGATPAPAPVPNVPQPEAPIDPAECQQRLLEHMQVQQNLVMNRLTTIEAEMDELERQDDLPDLKDADISTTKEAVATYIKELEIMKQIAKINAMANAVKEANRQSAAK